MVNSLSENSVSLSFITSQSLLKLMSIQSMMPSNSIMLSSNWTVHQCLVIHHFHQLKRTNNTNGLGDPSYSEQGKGSLGTSHEATGLKRAPWRRRRSIRQQPRVEVWSIDYSSRFWVSVPVLFLFTCVKWEKLVHFYVPQFPCL